MYKRGNRVDKLCYCVVSVLFAKDLKRFEAIWFGPSALAGEPVSDFKFEMNDSMAAEAGCSHRARSIYQKFWIYYDILRGMEVKCVPHILRESL